MAIVTKKPNFPGKSYNRQSWQTLPDGDDPIERPSEIAFLGDTNRFRFEYDSLRTDGYSRNHFLEKIYVIPNNENGTFCLFFPKIRKKHAFSPKISKIRCFTRGHNLDNLSVHLYFTNSIRIHSDLASRREPPRKGTSHSIRSPQ